MAASQERTDGVLLIDFDNAVGGTNPRATVVRRKVTALQKAAGPVDRAVAFFAVDGEPASEMTAVLVELGVDAHPVAAGPNAADIALLRYARQLHEQGYRRFVLASGDGCFHALAELGTLELVAWNAQAVAQRLRQSASAVRLAEDPKPLGPTCPKGDAVELVVSPGDAGPNRELRTPKSLSDRRAPAWDEVEQRANEIVRRHGWSSAEVPARVSNRWDNIDNRLLVAIFVCGGLFAGLIPAWASLAATRHAATSSAYLPVTVLMIVALLASVSFGRRWNDYAHRQRRIAVALWIALRAAVRAEATGTDPDLDRANRRLDAAAMAFRRNASKRHGVAGAHRGTISRQFSEYLHGLLLRQELGQEAAVKAAVLVAALAPVVAASLTERWTAVQLPDLAEMTTAQQELLDRAARSQWRDRAESLVTVLGIWAGITLLITVSAGYSVISLHGALTVGLTFCVAIASRSRGADVLPRLFEKVISK